MSNENGNKPAAPFVIGGDVIVQPEMGLTKREMLAMHEDVSSMFENYFDNYKEMASFVGARWESGFNNFQNISLEMKVKAKLKVMAADALLKELDNE